MIMVLETLEKYHDIGVRTYLHTKLGHGKSIRSLCLQSHAPSVFNMKEQIGLKSIKNPL
jgi:hypothetical protein